MIANYISFQIVHITKYTEIEKENTRREVIELADTAFRNKLKFWT